MAEPSTSKEQPLRLIFMGMGGHLSSAPLNVLLHAGYEFCAVIMAAPHTETGWRKLGAPAFARTSVPLLMPARSIMQLAWEQDIELFETGDLYADEVRAALQGLAPDVVLVSCFPYRIPSALLRVPRHGFLNLHPSRLPAYRGPYPLFWQLRDGRQRIGLTVQRMDENLDTGPVARQGAIELEDGMSGSQIDRLAGQRGGWLFVETLRALAAGELYLKPQPEGGSYQGIPGAQDFTLDRQWTARRAFNFMRGTAEWGQDYALVIGERRWLLRRALAYHPTRVQSLPVEESTDCIRIQLRSGVLEAV